ncbi:copia protein [Tanacetum coccineum]|uniref:Copia protein n=1 Tax=Tanacetum coccineum TaxID=301880 RepID=A0ABQ4Z9P4_9ASTR
MIVLESCPKHNMVAYLEKTEGNAEFHEVVDFLERSFIHLALTLTTWDFNEKVPRAQRGVVVRNKGRLVAQGHRQEEEIDYDEVFASVARIEAIRIFLAFASYMGFMVYQMDVKSGFLYGKIDEEVYVSQPPVLNLSILKKGLKVVKALYGLHQAQAPRACLLRCSRFQVNSKTSHLSAVKRIYRQETTFYDKQKACPLGYFYYIRQIGLLLQIAVGSFVDFKINVRLWVQFQNTEDLTLIMKVLYALLKKVFHSKTKHIAIRHHFIRDAYEKKLIQVLKIHTDDNVADLLTKAFDVSRF